MLHIMQVHVLYCWIVPEMSLMFDAGLYLRYYLLGAPAYSYLQVYYAVLYMVYMLTCMLAIVKPYVNIHKHKV